MVNPITDFAAVEFLVFYAMLIGLTVFLGRLWIRSRDETRFHFVPTLPVNPDPYEIACLKGGEEEVMKVAVAGLLQRGYLTREISEGIVPRDTDRELPVLTFLPAAHHPGIDKLTPLEASVFEWFGTPRTPEDLEKDLRWRVAAHCHTYEEKLRAESMFASEEMQEGATTTRLMALAVIAFFGVTRAVVAIGRDKPIGFLFEMFVAGCAIAWGLLGAPRLSIRGSRYLEQLRHSVDWMTSLSVPGMATPNFLMLVATAGFSPLAATEFACLDDVFKRSKQSEAPAGGCGGGGCGGCGGCG